MKNDTILLKLLVFGFAAYFIWKAGEWFGRFQAQIETNSATLARHEDRLLALEEDGRWLRGLRKSGSTIFGRVRGWLGL